MTRHSPGPWIAGSDDDPSEIVAADGTVVAEVGWGDDGADTAAANRNLIAAAPELLAALHAAYTWIGVMEGHFVNRVAGGKAIQADKGAGTLADLAKAIDGVLARAEGVP